MTDYLAQLLEEQLTEEQDRRGTESWETGPVRVPLPRQEEERTERLEMAGGENLSRSIQVEHKTETARSGENGPDWTARRWAAGQVETVLAGPGTTEQEAGASYGRAVGDEPALAGIIPVGSGAGWLDRAVRVSLEGLPQPQQTPGVITLKQEGADQSARRLELEQLDRLVRRDARRFDGGFQLL